jgi:uncharacterized protein (TIGR03437 family)
VIPKRNGVFGSSAVLDRIDPSPNPTAEIDSVLPLSSAQLFGVASVAPGELIRIQGHNLGPATELDPPLDSTGRLPFGAANVSITFDALPAPLISVQESAIECFVPFAASQSAKVTVTANGQKSNAARVGIAAQSPEILALTNEDGTANSAANPAAQGSVITVYVSGLGQTNPPSVDGQVNVSNAAVPLVPVGAHVGPFQVMPQFVGAAKGLIAGIMQVNLQVPTGTYDSSASRVVVNSASAPFYVVR